MVFADLSRTVDGVTEALEDMDLMVVAPLAVLGAGGAFVAQETVDLVFPQFDMPMDPSSTTELGMAAALKVFMAVLLVTVGARFGGKAMAGALTTIALGVLVHAGLDFFDMVQRGGIPGQAPQSSSSNTTTVTASPSRPSPSRSQTASRSRPTSTASPTRTANSPGSRRKELNSWG